MRNRSVSWWLTLVAAVWVFALVTWVTLVVFDHPVDVSGGTAAAYATMLGIPAIVIGFYQWARSRKDDDEDDVDDAGGKQ